MRLSKYRHWIYIWRSVGTGHTNLHRAYFSLTRFVIHRSEYTRKPQYIRIAVSSRMDSMPLMNVVLWWQLCTIDLDESANDSTWYHTKMPALKAYCSERYLEIFEITQVYEVISWNLQRNEKREIGTRSIYLALPLLPLSHILRQDLSWW